MIEYPPSQQLALSFFLLLLTTGCRASSKRTLAGPADDFGAMHLNLQQRQRLTGAPHPCDTCLATIQRKTPATKEERKKQFTQLVTDVHPAS